MDYPVDKPTVELRAVHLSKQDEGSEFLEKLPVLDEFNQWAHADWPGKIKSKEQLTKELADEEKTWGNNADFNYCEIGGYKIRRQKLPVFSMLNRSMASGGSSINMDICSFLWDLMALAPVLADAPEAMEGSHSTTTNAIPLSTALHLA